MTRLALALIVSLIAVACVPQQAAAPQAPIAQHVEAAKPEPKQPTLIERFTALAPVLGKCEQWGADSMVCHPSSTLALWCSAPVDGAKPKCEVALDWTPPAPAPDAKADPTLTPSTGKAHFTEASKKK